MREHSADPGTSSSASYYHLKVSSVTGNAADDGTYRVMHPYHAVMGRSGSSGSNNNRRGPTPYLFCSIGLDASSGASSILFKAFVISLMDGGDGGSGGSGRSQVVLA